MPGVKPAFPVGGASTEKSNDANTVKSNAAKLRAEAMSLSPEFPPFFDFPPFFYVQPHDLTRNWQLREWMRFVVDYCARNDILFIEIAEISTQKLPFKNEQIDRSLSLYGLCLVAKALIENGLASPDVSGIERGALIHKQALDLLFAGDSLRRGSGEVGLLSQVKQDDNKEDEVKIGGSGGFSLKRNDRILLFKKKILECADDIFSWALSTGRLNVVETIYGIQHGSDTVGESFHALTTTHIMLLLNVLKRQGKAQTFANEANPGVTGVKFFNN